MNLRCGPRVILSIPAVVGLIDVIFDVADNALETSNFNREPGTLLALRLNLCFHDQIFLGTRFQYLRRASFYLLKQRPGHGLVVVQELYET